MSQAEQEAYVAESLNRALDELEAHKKNGLQQNNVRTESGHKMLDAVGSHCHFYLLGVGFEKKVQRKKGGIRC